MTASDYNQNAGYGLRTGVTTSQLQESYQRAAEQREQFEAWAACALILLGAILLVVGYYVVRERRKLAQVTDDAVVAGLATGVRAARKARSKRDAFIGRVLAKADQKHPSED